MAQEPGFAADSGIGGNADGVIFRRKMRNLELGCAFRGLAQPRASQPQHAKTMGAGGPKVAGTSVPGLHFVWGAKTAEHQRNGTAKQTQS
jgi:hypothetical protein